MKRIECWNDLHAYGIRCLTGEACGLGYRILCDVTGDGKKILERVMEVNDLVLRRPWNGGEGVVGCIMLPYEMLTPIAVFALLGAGCTLVGLCDDGTRGLEPGDCEREEKILRRVAKRTLKPRGTAPGGMRNTHEMSGRVE